MNFEFKYMISNNKNTNNMAKRTTKTSSPTSNKKACLCEDGTYSKDCCKGELINQGIGDDKAHSISVITQNNAPRTIVTTN